MSNEEEPANLVISVLIAIAGLFACLIIGAVVVDLVHRPQNPDNNLLLSPLPSPSSQPPQ